MRMRCVALAMVSFWICTTPASAQSTSAWKGAGTSWCGEYAQNVRSGGQNMRDFYFTWAQGFMSALNTPPLMSGVAITNLEARTPPEQQAFIDQFCNQHPTASYVGAVLSLYDTMRSEQGLHDWRSSPKY
jgi:hypothetical protein